LTSRPLRVLIVEDSEDDARLLHRKLQLEGYDVISECVDSAEKMRAALTGKPWDLILCDYVMCGFGGIEALEIAKERAPDLPFIVVSGKIDEATAVEAMKAGASDYVAKARLERLLPAVKRELANISVRRASRHAQQELELKSAVFAMQQEASPDGILLVDENAKIASYNRRFLELWGVPEELAQTRVSEAVQQHVVRQMQDPKGSVAKLRQLYEHRDQEGQDELHTRDGRIVECHSVPVTGPAGKYYGRIWYFRDITQRKRAEERVRQSEALLRSIADHIPALIAYVDASQTYRFANAAYEALFELAPERIIGRTMREILGDSHLEAQPHIEDALGGRRAMHDTMVSANEHSYYMHNVYVPHFAEGGKVAGMFILAVDISDRKALEQDLTYKANHDSLTGLPNRALFDDRLQQALERSKRFGTALALMYIDVDRFKLINDTHGHHAGDRILKAFATRLRECVRSTDTVARVVATSSWFCSSSSMTPHMREQSRPSSSLRCKRGWRWTARHFRLPPA